MKPFEEQFTAWLDGQLSEVERAEFEAQFPDAVAAFAEKDEGLKLGNLLRNHGAAPQLSNPDFFNSQIMRQIEAELPRAAAPATASKGWSLFGLPTMVWSGFGFIAAAVVLTLAIIPQSRQPLTGERYVAQVLKTHAGDRGLSATAFHSTENNLTVVWVDGDVDSNEAPAASHAQ
ncbi:MAG: hypothetical protein QM796_06685 [Chthoniobacteraceae bacterium]